LANSGSSDPSAGVSVVTVGRASPPSAHSKPHDSDTRPASSSAPFVGAVVGRHAGVASKPLCRRVSFFFSAADSRLIIAPLVFSTLGRPAVAGGNGRSSRRWAASGLKGHRLLRKIAKTTSRASSSIGLVPRPTVIFPAWRRPGGAAGRRHDDGCDDSRANQQSGWINAC